MVTLTGTPGEGMSVQMDDDTTDLNSNNTTDTSGDASGGNSDSTYSDPYSIFVLNLMNQLNNTQKATSSNVNALQAQSTALSGLSADQAINPQLMSPSGGLPGQPPVLPGATPGTGTEYAYNQTLINPLTGQYNTGLQGLDASQQQAIIKGGQGIYQGEQNVIGDTIKAQNTNLSNFESILGQLNTMGENVATLNPTPEVISSYALGLTKGMSITSIPDTGNLRSKVIQSMTPEQLQQWEDSQKPQIIHGYDSAGNPIDYLYTASTQTAVPIGFSGATTAQRNQAAGITAPSTANAQGKINLSQSEIQKLEGTKDDKGVPLFTPSQVAQIQKVYSLGGTPKNLSAAQQKELDTVLSKPPAQKTAGTMIGDWLGSALNELGKIF